MRHPLIALITITIVLLAGCTSHKVTVSNDGTTVTTSGDNQTVTVQGKEGSFTAGKGAVDTSKLGLPVYPGANASDSAGWSGQSREGTGTIAVLKTADSFDKVYAWYRAKMPVGSEQSHVTSSGSSMAAFAIGKESDKEQKTVTLSSGSDGTTIMLVVGAKTK